MTPHCEIFDRVLEHCTMDNLVGSGGHQFQRHHSTTLLERQLGATL